MLPLQSFGSRGLPALAPAPRVVSPVLRASVHRDVFVLVDLRQTGTAPFGVKVNMSREAGSGLQ